MNEKSQQPSTGFEQEYSEKNFWAKLKSYARKAGIDVVNPALQLYYASQSKDTPPWAKGVIYGALGYFISMIDAVPDITPIVGYTDDLGVMVAALAAIAVNITPEIKQQAKNKAQHWFGEDEDKTNKDITTPPHFNEED